VGLEGWYVGREGWWGLCGFAAGFFCLVGFGVCFVLWFVWVFLRNFDLSVLIKVQIFGLCRGDGY